MLAFILQGAAIGLSAAGTPGPLQAYLISHTLANGWRRAAPIAFAPLVTDAILAPIILLALGQIPPAFLQFVRLAGAALLFYLALGLWRSLRQPAAGQPAPSSGRSIRTALLMNFLSPGPYLFWSLISGPMLLEAWRASPAHAIAFLLSFYGIFIGGMLALAAVFHQAHRFGPAVIRALQWASLAILLLFSLLLFANFLTQ